MTKYHVCTSNSLNTRDGVLLPGQAFDSEEAGLSEADCKRLLAAGRISVEIEGGKFTMHGDRVIPPEQTIDPPAGHVEPKQPAEQTPPQGGGNQPPKKWTFTDDQLAGKNLTELNGLIAERGGAPQPTVEEAMVLLQSETD